MACNCGNPRRANYYSETIIGRGDSSSGTETRDFSDYYCEKHVPDDDGSTVLSSAMKTKGWYVIGHAVTYLRG